jgi:hypothetical protein
MNDNNNTIDPRDVDESLSETHKNANGEPLPWEEAKAKLTPVETKKETMTQSELPEAPASVTYSVTSKDGFNALFTIRGTSGKDLLTTMEKIEEVLVTRGYKPQEKRTFGAKKEVEYVEKTNCPKCGGRLVKKFTKENKLFHKCENGKYDFTTKTNTGCDYINFLN